MPRATGSIYEVLRIVSVVVIPHADRHGCHVACWMTTKMKTNPGLCQTVYYAEFASKFLNKILVLFDILAFAYDVLVYVGCLLRWIVLSVSPACCH